MPAALTVVLGLSAGFTFFFCRRNHLVIRQFEGTPTTAIGDLTEGVREIKGTVSDASTTVPAPMSGEDCVWYSLHVEEAVQRGKSRHWETRGRRTHHGECFVEDGTGTCLVDLDDADHALTGGARSTSGTFDDPSDPELAALAEFDLAGENFLGMNRRFRYRETVLRRGDPLFARGPCEIDVHGMAVMSTFHTDRVLFSNQSEAKLVRGHKQWRALQLILFLGSAVGAVASLVV